MVMGARRTRVWRSALLGAGVVLGIGSTVGVQAAPLSDHRQDHPGDVTAVEMQYLPGTVSVQQGETFSFGNYDPRTGIPGHSIDEYVPECTNPPWRNCDRYPRFSSGLVDHGHVSEVAGVEDLAPGTYTFTCQVHPRMRGTLIVEE